MSITYYSNVEIFFSAVKRAIASIESARVSPAHDRSRRIPFAKHGP